MGRFTFDEKGYLAQHVIAFALGLCCQTRKAVVAIKFAPTFIQLRLLVPNAELDISEEEIEAFFKRHEKEARRNPEDDFWYMSPLCPPVEMDALDAIKKLHQELQEWVKEKGHPSGSVEFWDRETARSKGHIYGENGKPLAQIAWLHGPEHWPLGLLDARSFGKHTFKHQDKEYYLEAADKYVLSLQPL